MSKITCIVLDDEQHAVDLMAEYAVKTPFLQLLHATTNPMEAFDWLGKCQLCISDIDMPGLTGAELVQGMHNKMKFILCTAYPEYAAMGYEFDVIDYMIKPVTYPRFLKAVEKARELLKGNEPSASDGMFIQSNGKGRYFKIAFADIRYIEGGRNFIHIHTVREKIIYYQSLKEITNQLPPDVFMRIHNSYIVNLTAIKSIEGNAVTLTGTKETIQCSTSFRAELLKRLKITG
jgi:DNA-binding LytR/AlgR family response regulator